MVTLNNNCLLGKMLNTGLNLPKNSNNSINEKSENLPESKILSNFLIELNKNLQGINAIIKSSFGLFLALIKQVKGFKNREEAKLIISCIFQIIYSTCNEQNLQIKQNVVDIDIAKKSGKSYADHFFQFIQFNLNYIEVPNLGEEFFFENYLPIGDTKFDSVDYQIEILLKYERFLLRRYDL